MIHFEHFKKYAVTPITRHFPRPRRATQHLMAFAAHESRGGTYMQQISGPAMGPYQMEPPTKRLVDRWVGRHRGDPIWGTDVYLNSPMDELRTDLKCATWYARILLLADPSPLAALDDWEALYGVYRQVWRPGKPPTLEGFREAHRAWRRGV
jgi:hypothetical protein